MPHLGTLRDFAFTNDIDDVRGTALYGADDEKLGKIDDVIFDHASGDIRYVVVDTGGWLTHKKFLVPADRVHSYSKNDDAFQVDLAKDQVEKKFPRYDEKMLASEKDWSNYEAQYRKAWEDDPVQHQEGRVDLDVTPGTIEAGMSPTGVPSAREAQAEVHLGSMGEEVSPDVENAAEKDIEQRRTPSLFEEENDIEGRDLTPHRLAGKFPEVIEGSNKLQMRPSVAEERDFDQARVGSSRVPDRVWEDNATGSSGRLVEPSGGAGATSNEFPLDAGNEVTARQNAANNEVPASSVPLSSRADESQRNEQDVIRRVDVGRWHPRMKRFEDVLKKNRVDVTASCASCAPAKDRAA